jgi:putative toxin-antitoxin system antitoxin component (TIGR02293 family)
MFSSSLHPNIYYAYRARLEALLLIPSTASDHDIHELIEAGFTGDRVISLCEAGVISPTVRDQIIPYKTLKTRVARHQRLTASESDRLFRAAHVISMAEALFGDEDKARRWLAKFKSRFSGKSPFAMLSTTQGTHMVEEVLLQASEGFTF